MQFKHAPAAVSAVFDDPNLVSAAGLVPMLRLARSAGLDELAQHRLSVPTDRGANACAGMAPAEVTLLDEPQVSESLRGPSDLDRKRREGKWRG